MEKIEKKYFYNNSEIKQKVISSMKVDNKYWIDYYKGKKNKINHLLINSKLDRIRYYWDKEKVKKSLHILKKN